jgi:hypothetical protein
VRTHTGAALQLAVALAVLLAGAAGCKQKPPPDAPSRTPPRTDFTPAEFGVGRAHTKNAACNREIDQMLEEVRHCYNTRPAAECDVLQRADAEKTARLKNSRHCSR